MALNRSPEINSQSSDNSAKLFSFLREDSGITNSSDDSKMLKAMLRSSSQAKGTKY